MQYSTLLVAAAAFSGLVGAQNLTLPTGIQPCCTVQPNSVPQSQRETWCKASTNTCPELCGGQGNIASGGNDCSPSTLAHTCECRNGTKPNLAEYEQTVEAQMCRFWYSGCINATNQDASLQFNCDQTRNNLCGNKTSKAATSSGSGSSSALPSRTNSAGSSEGTSGAASSPSPSSAAMALDVVREYGTPLLAGGMAAVFGLVL
ncbi:hypothetical protein CC80DRAFT_494178 [Byssothecium circinans]|uniref:DUF7707 domain-containing protein n=1 Tax=Byssothecium circinans TaxID=147558 RepID=A0A6A5TQL1_9PLEO|nr:hypothetical protein CC80DRAFT_494178 [Byssothecium circinans]